MPRVGWTKPEKERRLSDLVSVGLLTRVFPMVVIDPAHMALIAACTPTKASTRHAGVVIESVVELIAAVLGHPSSTSANSSRLLRQSGSPVDKRRPEPRSSPCGVALTG